MAAAAIPALAAVWWPLVAAILGLVAGQVANIAIRALPSFEWHRWPLTPCLHCNARGGGVDAMAITAWLQQGGRCRRCRTRMSVVAPLVELCNALLWGLLAYERGPSIRAVVLMIFVTALLALIVIDFQHFLLPDAITLPGIVVGVAACWIPGWPVSLLDSALSAGLGYFAMMALAMAAEWYYGEEALGQGDWKMVAMLGAFLGSTKVITTVLVANGAGAVFGLLLVATLGERGRQKLPLGSFLGAAGIAVAFW
jgi:leader peptidase (prepilin peptidase)/N-methyltransferase